MNDQEITDLCAEAMGLDKLTLQILGSGMNGAGYYPLRNDVDAMALVKRCDLCLEPNSPQVAKWAVWPIERMEFICHNHDLNRAICECVAKMQAAKQEA